jgi:hypothetical protein
LVNFIADDWADMTLKDKLASEGMRRLVADRVAVEGQRWIIRYERFLLRWIQTWCMLSANFTLLTDVWTRMSTLFFFETFTNADIELFVAFVEKRGKGASEEETMRVGTVNIIGGALNLFAHRAREMLARGTDDSVIIDLVGFEFPIDYVKGRRSMPPLTEDDNKGGPMFWRHSPTTVIIPPEECLEKEI